MKTVAFIGGSPLVYQSFAALQQGLKEAIVSLALPYGNVRLFGCVDNTNDFINTLNYTTSAGWIILDQEPLYMPAQSYSQPSVGTRKFVVYKTTVTSPYPEADSDGVTRDMVINATAAIKSVANSYVLQNGEAFWPSLRKYDEVIKDKVNAENIENWTIVNSFSPPVSVMPHFLLNWQNGDGLTPPTNTEGWNLRLRKNIDYVEFDGFATFSSGSPQNPSSVILIVQASYRPTNDKRIPVVVNVSNESSIIDIAYILVKRNGEIELLTNYSGVSLTVNFSNVRYKI